LLPACGETGEAILQCPRYTPVRPCVTRAIKIPGDGLIDTAEEFVRVADPADDIQAQLGELSPQSDGWVMCWGAVK